MARNGVWELQRVVLRYSLSDGSSRGVREYVENGLVAFAEKNPQIQFKTRLQKGHPNVRGWYITKYERQQSLKNLSAEKVGAVLQDLRDTLGRKVPKHSDISNRVVEQKKVSVQGVWRNMRDLSPDAPEVIEKRERLQAQCGLHDLVEEVGITGIVQMTQQIIAERDAARQAALASLPRPYKVKPTV